MPASPTRPFLTALAVAGTLDILSAFAFSALAGGPGPAAILSTLASGPFPSAGSGPLWALAGLGVHFAIMAVMVAAWFLAAARLPVLIRHPVPLGLAYGVLLWFVMYWLVLPWRWASVSPPSDPVEIAKQLFSHCILVGLPIAVIAARHFRRRARPFS